MGRCEKCGKKVTKIGKRSCKSDQKIKENNANNAQIINVDVIPDVIQTSAAANGVPQNGGAVVPSPATPIVVNGSVPGSGHSSSSAMLTGLTADEVKNILRGATDYAAETAEKQNAAQQHAQDDHGGRGKRKNKKQQKHQNVAKNNKINVNLALILTRASQVPTIATTQSVEQPIPQVPPTTASSNAVYAPHALYADV